MLHLRDRQLVGWAIVEYMHMVSLAVLADTSLGFRPMVYHYARWGCELTFTFPSAKLIDWEESWTKLEVSENVFALMVMAQIKAKRHRDGASRKEARVALLRLLFDRGDSREQILRLFTLIDWRIPLPRGGGSFYRRLRH